MANRDNPFGLQYLTYACPYPPRTEVFEKQSTFGTAIFQNDVVHQIAGVTGFNKAPIEAWSSATPGTTLPMGVSLNYGAASTRTRHHVIVDPTTLYVAQDNDDTDGISAEDLGSNANIEAGAGSTTTGFSGHEIDESTVNTSADRDVKLLQLFPDPDNAFGEHARIIVQFNDHRRANNTVGV